MQGLMVVTAPFVLMLFALTMQRLEADVARPARREDHAQVFALRANSDETDPLLEQGIAKTMSIFDLRGEKSEPARRNRHGFETSGTF